MWGIYKKGVVTGCMRSPTLVFALVRSASFCRRVAISSASFFACRVRSSLDLDNWVRDSASFLGLFDGCDGEAGG